MGHGEEPYHSEIRVHTQALIRSRSHARGQFPVYSSLKGNIPISLSHFLLIFDLALSQRPKFFAGF